MKPSFDLPRLARAFAGGLALWACNPDASPTPASSAPSGHLASYRYDGVAGASDVTRERADSGRESLQGSTDLARETRSFPRTLARESVQLDPSGRLERAELIVGVAGTRYTLDAMRGMVHIERPGLAKVDWRVPVDAPWLYAPAFDADGDLAVTPVSAWVALRAAGAASVADASTATANVVRVLEPEQQRSYLVMVDQIAVPTERGTTIALGYDAADADERFVSELRLFHGPVILARVAMVDLGV